MKEGIYWAFVNDGELSIIEIYREEGVMANGDPLYGDLVFVEYNFEEAWPIPVEDAKLTLIEEIKRPKTAARPFSENK